MLFPSVAVLGVNLSSSLEVLGTRFDCIDCLKLVCFMMRCRVLGAEDSTSYSGLEVVT